jgi:hypothetical protein
MHGPMYKWIFSDICLFIICTFSSYYYGDKIKDNEIAGACTTYTICEEKIKDISQKAWREETNLKKYVYIEDWREEPNLEKYVYIEAWREGQIWRSMCTLKPKGKRPIWRSMCTLKPKGKRPIWRSMCTLKPKGKRPIWRSMCTLKDNIKIDFRINELWYILDSRGSWHWKVELSCE